MKIGPYVNERYKDATLSKTNLTREQQINVAKWIKDPKNFLIYLGRPGCGKTYFCIAAAKYIYELNTKEYDAIISCRYGEEPIIQKHKSEPNIYYCTNVQIYSEFKRCYSSHGDDGYVKEKFRDLEYLIIDDFGATRNNEWQVEIMTELIDSRYSNLRPTIITSNLTFKDMGEIFHERIKSRLMANENLIIEDWDTDLRQNGH